MKRIYISVLWGLFFCYPAFAQFDSIVNSFRQEFERFRQDIEQEYRQFKSKNDSVFYLFLKDSWEEFEVLYKELPEPPKPVVQPVREKETAPMQHELIPIPADSIELNLKPDDNQEKVPGKKPAEKSDNFGYGVINFDFYGSGLKIAYPGKFQANNQIDEKGIQLFFEKTCNLPVIYDLIEELQQIKKQMRLNDWGYFKLVEETIREIEPTGHQQVLLAWIIMLKSGYNVKLGFNTSDLFLMFPSDEEVYSSYYFIIDDISYYIHARLEEGKSFPRIRVHKANYPGSKKFSMQLYEIPLLGDQLEEKGVFYKGNKINITINKSLAQFYADYPHCDLKVYFSAPISTGILKPLEDYFQTGFSDKTNAEKVAILLSFVQNSFEYKTDGDQFGSEKYFFPDEVFIHPFSDCEDRSVLFARLVRYFTGNTVVGLDFPGHVNTAVLFDEEIEGTFITLNDRKFMVCDPTYQNAPVGYLDTRYKKYQPKVIICD
jgi:hypothetical protein